MKLIYRCLAIALLVAQSLDASCGDARREELLPVYQGLIEVVDKDGASLLPEKRRLLGFSSLSLKRTPGFQPMDLGDAACELGKMLPSDFMSRLLVVRREIARLASTPSDPAVSERVFDLAIYIDETWGIEWSSEADPILRLSAILEATPTCGEHE